MNYSNNYKDIGKFLSWLLMFACVAGTSQAATDDYMKALELEAKKSASITAPSTTVADPALKEAQKDLEKRLEAAQPSTFGFYKKLTDKNRTEVITQFKTHQSLDATRKTVLDLYILQSK